jgi:hypothetical protein
MEKISSLLEAFLKRNWSLKIAFDHQEKAEDMFATIRG